MNLCRQNSSKKVTKGQIHDGSISQNTFHVVYKSCAKCHAFIKKCIIICYAPLLRWRTSVTKLYSHIFCVMGTAAVCCKLCTTAYFGVLPHVVPWALCCVLLSTCAVDNAVLYSMLFTAAYSVSWTPSLHMCSTACCATGSAASCCIHAICYHIYFLYVCWVYACTAS